MDKKFESEDNVLEKGDPHSLRIRHLCGPSTQCKCKDRADTVERLTNVYVNWALGRRPTPPEMEEFSAVSRAMRYTGCLVLNHRIIQQAFLIAIGKLTPQRRVHALTALPAANLAAETTPGQKGNSSTREWFANLSWHEMIGKRLVQIQEHFLTDNGVFHTGLLSFYAVAVEHITAFYAARSSAFARFDTDIVPPLCDLTWSSRSPYTLVLQWLSAVLLPDSPILHFHIRGAKYESLLSFIADEASQAVRPQLRHGRRLLADSQGALASQPGPLVACGHVRQSASVCGSS